jgi:uncharacterized protein with HEPN domain
MENLYPDIPWRDVRGLSNIIRHVYDDVDLGIIWTTATQRIHPVREAALHEIARLGQNADAEAHHNTPSVR